MKKINILTYKKWCNHCRDHVDEEVHHQSCEFARLKRENKFLQEIIDEIFISAQKGKIGKSYE